MAKPSKQQVMTKKHLARVEREAIQTRWILIGAISTIVIVLGLIGYGILNQYVLAPYQPVAKVGSDKVSLQELIDQTRLARYNLVNQYNQIEQMAQYFGSDASTSSYFSNQLSSISSQLDPVTLGQSVLNQLIEDKLIRQEAKRRGITVTAQEVDKAVQEAFGYTPNGTPTPAPTFPVVPTSTLNPTQFALVPPTATPTTEPITTTATVTATLEVPTETPTVTPTAGSTSTPLPTATPLTEEGYKTRFDETLKNLKDSAGVTEQILRDYFEISLYRQKVKDAVVGEMNLKPEQEEVWARHILVADEATANSVEERLKNGEDFATLAKELSTDTGSGANGGDLGWFGRGQMIKEFEDTVFAMTTIGQISDPVKSTYGYHIIQLLGKEVRPMTETQFDQEKETKFSEWLGTQRTAANVEVFDNWFDKVPKEPSVAQATPSSQ
jgi:parvulin-like peptidyl-prolyl isomerase